MKITIKTLEIKNFKGIDSAVFNFKAGENVIYGDNATGKTTVCDAFMWLLIEKDSLGQSSFKLYNLGKDSSPEVTAFLDIDGEEVYLKKKAVRNSKNGSSKLKYYFNNELSIKKKAYIDKLDKIGIQEIIKTLISLNYFNTLKWEQQREILMGMVNIDTSFEDIIASDERLSVLPDIIDKNTIAEHKAIALSEKKATEKLLGETSVIITDVLNEMSEYRDILVPSEIEQELFTSKEIKEKAEREKLRLEAGGEIAEKRKQLAAIQTDIINLENDFETRQNVKASAKRKEISDIEGKILGLENTRNRLHAEINDLSETLEAQKKEISDLRKTWKDEFNRVFTEAGDCPECGASPEHQKNVKTIESFNREKSERLEAINKRGKELSVKLQDIEKLIKKLEKQRSEQTEKIRREREKISSLEIKLEEIFTASVKTKKYQELAEKEAALINYIDKLKAGGDLKQQVAALDDKIRDADSKIADCYKELEKAERREKLKTKVKSIKEKEKDLSSRIEKLEQELSLIDLFNEVRVKMLEDKINSIFEITSWKMFEKQVNGAIKPVCIPMFNGVPWNTNLNRAHRKIVGVDIIKTLSKYYNLYLPLFIDDAEGITSLPEINTQMIRLVKPEITGNNKEYYSKLQIQKFKGE